MVSESKAADDWRCPKLSRVVHNLNIARKYDKFTDVTFVVGPDGDACTIKAHRVVLGTANRELERLVSGRDKHLKIWMKDVSPKGFKNLIRFLYDTDVKFSDLSAVRETLLVAEKFKVYKLKLATENFLNRAVMFVPSLEMLQIALKFDMPKLQYKCIDIISTKYRDVLKSEELASFSFEVVKAVLSVRPCHGEECQYQALLAIGKWKKKHETERKHLESLLRCVDFTRVRMTDFDEFIKKTEGLLSDVDVRALVKYNLSKKVRDAPKWYRSTAYNLKRIDCDTDDEENDSVTDFSKRMEHHKSNVEKVLDKEKLYIEKSMKKMADVISEYQEKFIDDAVKEICYCFNDALEDSVEIAFEIFDVPDFTSHEEEINKEITVGEKGSIEAASEKIADGENESIEAASEKIADGENESIEAASEKIADGENESIEAASEKIADGENESIEAASEKIADRENESIEAASELVPAFELVSASETIAYGGKKSLKAASEFVPASKKIAEGVKNLIKATSKLVSASEIDAFLK